VNKTKALRRLLERPRATLVGGVHDGLSAGLAEQAGFDALWASGFCISASKRLADVGIVTMTEHLAATREINRASDLPVVADVDDGFGDAVNVTRMVREYEAAGVAAICMEDSRHPKRCSLFGELRRQLATSDEFASKIRAAKAAQRDPDFVVIARVEALIADLGVDEALRRARVYAAAGADMVVVHSKDPDPTKIREFGTRWDGGLPLVAIPTKYPQMSASDLYEAGYRMVIFANQGLRAAISAMDRVFRRMVETGVLTSVEGEVAPLSQIFDLVGFDEVGQIEARFPAGPVPETESEDK
jgi:phosphoenolpyruvate phosphomutase